jgi:hypothetical protein
VRARITLTAAILATAAIAAGTYVLLRKRPLSQVTRTECLAIAASYVAHEWTASEANIFHGADPEGIRVDTPDVAFQPPGDDRGWWLTGQKNVGIPYKWGGFDTPEEFDHGLRAGRYAGDVYSAEKRRLLDAGVSTRAVGIDCSGLISRCWKLPRSYSTRELPGLCDPIRDLSQLAPGDIFNRHNKHVRLFAGWSDTARTRIVVYEAAAKVSLNEHSLQAMLDEGYSAWRYHGIRD